MIGAASSRNGLSGRALACAGNTIVRWVLYPAGLVVCAAMLWFALAMVSATSASAAPVTPAMARTSAPAANPMVAAGPAPTKLRPGDWDRIVRDVEKKAAARRSKASKPRKATCVGERACGNQATRGNKESSKSSSGSRASGGKRGVSKGTPTQQRTAARKIQSSAKKLIKSKDPKKRATGKKMLKAGKKKSKVANARIKAQNLRSKRQSTPRGSSGARAQSTYRTATKEHSRQVRTVRRAEQDLKQARKSGKGVANAKEKLNRQRNVLDDTRKELRSTRARTPVARARADRIQQRAGARQGYQVSERVHQSNAKDLREAEKLRRAVRAAEGRLNASRTNLREQRATLRDLQKPLVSRAEVESKVVGEGKNRHRVIVSMSILRARGPGQQTYVIDSDKCTGSTSEGCKAHTGFRYGKSKVASGSKSAPRGLQLYASERTRNGSSRVTSRGDVSGTLGAKAGTGSNANIRQGADSKQPRGSVTFKQRGKRKSTVRAQDLAKGVEASATGTSRKGGRKATGRVSLAGIANCAAAACRTDASASNDSPLTGRYGAPKQLIQTTAGECSQTTGNCRLRSDGGKRTLLNAGHAETSCRASGALGTCHTKSQGIGNAATEAVGMVPGGGRIKTRSSSALGSDCSGSGPLVGCRVTAPRTEGGFTRNGGAGLRAERRGKAKDATGKPIVVATCSARGPGARCDSTAFGQSHGVPQDSPTLWWDRKKKITMSATQAAANPDAVQLLVPGYKKASGAPTDKQKVQASKRTTGLQNRAVSGLERLGWLEPEQAVVNDLGKLINKTYKKRPVSKREIRGFKAAGTAVRNDIGSAIKKYDGAMDKLYKVNAAVANASKDPSYAKGVRSAKNEMDKRKAALERLGAPKTKKERAKYERLSKAYQEAQDAYAKAIGVDSRSDSNVLGDLELPSTLTEDIPLAMRSAGQQSSFRNEKGDTKWVFDELSDDELAHQAAFETAKQANKRIMVDKVAQSEYELVAAQGGWEQHDAWVSTRDNPEKFDQWTRFLDKNEKAKLKKTWKDTRPSGFEHLAQGVADGFADGATWVLNKPVEALAWTGRQVGVPDVIVDNYEKWQTSVNGVIARTPEGLVKLAAAATQEFPNPWVKAHQLATGGKERRPGESGLYHWTRNNPFTGMIATTVKQGYDWVVPCVGLKAGNCDDLKADWDKDPASTVLTVLTGPTLVLGGVGVVLKGASLGAGGVASRASAAALKQPVKDGLFSPAAQALRTKAAKWDTAAGRLNKASSIGWSRNPGLQLMSLPIRVYGPLARIGARGATRTVASVANRVGATRVGEAATRANESLRGVRANG
ncbi:MAG: hypothetical protein H0W01_07915, partial [Pseudonocardiales bacterium]|nr:hypothetical protein [Pseudonocardiales bacterium]